MSLYVDPTQFSASIHGDKLNCNDCHSDINDVPHPEKTWKNRRAFTLALYESCKKCHFANYTKTLESVHYKELSKGDTRAPVCIDCHGSHYIHQPSLSKVMISQTCRSCHEKVYQTYSKSVHGNALLLGKNSDAPVCTDCHRAHDIEDPRTANFLEETPELCGKCHGNQALMKKYGLSSAVLKTYLQDFHGVSISFYKQQKNVNMAAWKAVCTDCHGVHDITKVTAQNSPVLKRNLLNNCRKCHTNASENFPDAWLSHYEPSTDKAPLVYYAALFYKLFIPFTIGGLVLHILLHIWRIATNR
jgi:predicted CXXCH cytochrome family protein